VSAADPFQAFLAAPWPTAPAEEPPDAEEAFLANEAALSTCSLDERCRGYQATMPRAFGLAGPDTEAGA
jgi:hypothetical protein